MPLTERQQRFVEAFAQHGCATQAAREAGYSDASDATLATQGSRLLRNVEVRSAIDAIAQEAKSDLIAARVERLVYLTRIVRGQEMEPRVTQEGVQMCEPAIKDRMAAAMNIAKMQGELLEKREISGPGGGPVEVTSLGKLSNEQLLAYARGEVLETGGES